MSPERLIAWAEAREPNHVIGIGRDDGRGYMSRWCLIPRNRLMNIYLHRFSGDDDDRALHDHPWPSISLCLDGALLEHYRGADGGDVVRYIPDGQWTYRGPWFAHRLQVLVVPTWTLFITGPKVRSWGFHCPQGWRHWTEFVDAGDPGRVGRGCD